MDGRRMSELGRWTRHTRSELQGNELRSVRQRREETRRGRVLGIHFAGYKPLAFLLGTLGVFTGTHVLIVLRLHPGFPGLHAQSAWGDTRVLPSRLLLSVICIANPGRSVRLVMSPKTPRQLSPGLKKPRFFTASALGSLGAAAHRGGVPGVPERNRSLYDRRHV